MVSTMSSISAQSLDFPQEMKDLPQWVVWDLIQKPGKPKPDKIPINPKSEEWASVSNPNSWGTFDEAVASYTRVDRDYHGVGFMITQKDPIVFIDLDSVIKDGKWNPLVQQTLDKVPSWAEFSQSGNGIHIMAKAEGMTVKTQGIEVYHYGRFVALTGRHIPTSPKELVTCQEGTDWLKTQVDEQGGQETKPAAPAPVDQRLMSMDRIGLEYTFKGSGKAEMVCPWGHEHGNGDPNGAVYMPAHYNGRATANFFCQHATCQAQNRSNIGSFDTWLSNNDKEYNIKTLYDAFKDVPLPTAGAVAGDIEVADQGPKPLFSSVMDLLREGQTAPRWIIKKMVERGQVGVIYGDSGTLKSYICLDMAAHIVNGREWHGHKITLPGPVLYLAGEGNHGVKSRCEALRQRHKWASKDLANMYASHRGIDIMKDEDLMTLAETVVGMESLPVLLIVDTLSRNADLDENSARDIAALVARCTSIAHAWDCSVLIVHHTGKAQAGARGSSALTANTDYRFRVEREEEAAHLEPITTLTIEKLKSAPDTSAIPLVFRAKKVTLIGIEDEDGETISDLALVPALLGDRGIPASIKTQLKLTTKETELLSVAGEIILQSESMSTAANQAGATKDEIRVAYESFMEDKGTPTRRSNFNRTLGNLVDKGALRIRDTEDEGVWYLLNRK